MADKKQASEVAGELRKAARLYEVFKNAADAAAVLAEYEAREKAHKKNIALLAKEESELDHSCDIISAKIGTKKTELSILETKVSEADKEYRSILSDSENKANIEAERIIASAKTELESLNTKIQQSKKDVKSLNLKIVSAQNKLDNVLNHIEKVKADALEALA